jgi:hypothetical protein
MSAPFGAGVEPSGLTTVNQESMLFLRYLRHLIGSVTTFPGNQSARSSVQGLVLVGLLCVALVLQGAHVCPYAQHSAPGVQNALCSASTVCSVCAVAGSVLIVVSFVLLLLLPSGSRPSFAPVAARPFWRVERLYVRPPPLF